MSGYLLRFERNDAPEETDCADEQDVMREIQALLSGGVDARSLILYARVPLQIETSIRVRITKRRKATPAPAQEATPPPPLGAGGSTEEQLYKGDVPECLMEGCREPGEMGDMCAKHFVAGISDKTKAKLRSREAAERSAAGPLKENSQVSSPEGKR